VNLKTTLNEIKTSLSEVKHPGWKAAIAIGILIVCVVLYAWCSAPSYTEVPKGVVLEQDADDQHAEAQSDYYDADELAKQSAAVEAKRQKAKKALEDIHADRRALEARRLELEKEYEKVRNANVSVSDADLDARERRLLAELRELQQ
jgi:hypothetical protein